MSETALAHMPEVDLSRPCGAQRICGTLPGEAVTLAMDSIFRELVRTHATMGVGIETMHHFQPGTYVRTVLMKADDIVVGYIHNKDHIIIISAGRGRFISNETGIVEVIAPAIFTSKAGSYRTVYIDEDMVWTTVHSANATTVEEAEVELFAVPESYVRIKEEFTCQDG